MAVYVCVCVCVCAGMRGIRYRSNEKRCTVTDDATGGERGHGWSPATTRTKGVGSGPGGQLTLEGAGLVHTWGWAERRARGYSWEGIYGASLRSGSVFSLKQGAKWVGGEGGLRRKHKTVAQESRRRRRPGKYSWVA